MIYGYFLNFWSFTLVFDYQALKNRSFAAEKNQNTCL